VPATDAKYSAFVRHNSATELRDVKGVGEGNLDRILSVDVPKMNGFGAPFEIVHKLVRRIAFL